MLTFGLLAREKKVELVKLFIDNFKDEIDINLQNKNLLTVMHLSCDNFNMIKLLIDNFKHQININLTNIASRTVLQTICYHHHDDIAKLIIDNFKDSIDIMTLDDENKPVWFDYLYFFMTDDQDDFKDLFLNLLLNRDKSKDPYGLTPLHIVYLYRNQVSRVLDDDDEINYVTRGEFVLDYFLNELPELVELDISQRDKFQTLPHQVTPLPGHGQT